MSNVGIMSELYLTLRSRLEVVKGDWVEIGTDQMIQARKQRGLSREGAARLIPVSMKTLERWELEHGAVPRQWVERYAEVIGLGIERVPAGTIKLEPSGEVALAEELAAVRKEMQALREALERLPLPRASESR